MAIIDESGEGTMHEVHKIAVGGRRGTECKVGRQNEYSIHMEVRTLYARRMFREKQICGIPTRQKIASKHILDQS